MQKAKIVFPILIAIFFMVLDHKFNAFAYVKNTVNFIITPIYKIIDFPSSVYDYLNQPKTSDAITQELLVLKNKEHNYNLLLLENQRLSEILETSYNIVDNKFSLARITNIKQSRLRKIAIIDKGAGDNIKVGDVVLSNSGIVGRVIEANYSYSTIRLISDPLSYIPIINTRSGVRGVAKGVSDNSNNLVIQNIPANTDIAIGDTWTTSGKAGVFYNGFNVGKVIDIKQNNNNFIDVILEPTQKIEQTIFVLVNIN